MPLKETTFQVQLFYRIRSRLIRLIFTCRQRLSSSSILVTRRLESGTPNFLLTFYNGPIVFHCKSRMIFASYFCLKLIFYLLKDMNQVIAGIYSVFKRIFGGTYGMVCRINFLKDIFPLWGATNPNRE